MGSSCGKCLASPPPAQLLTQKTPTCQATLQRSVTQRTIKRECAQKKTDPHTRSLNDQTIENAQTFTQQGISFKKSNLRVSTLTDDLEKQTNEYLRNLEQECLGKALEVMRARQEEEGRRKKKKEEMEQSSRKSQSSRRSVGDMSFVQDLGSSERVRLKRHCFIRLVKQNVNERYTFLQKLGEGSFGSVHKARCQITGEQRAIKIIRKGRSSKMQDNLFGQLELLKTLDHPNIIKLYEIFDYKDFYYVVIQYCGGGQLFDAVKKNHHFSQMDAAKLMKQLLSAVNYMHQSHIVHRDLKPQNIVFVSPPGQDIKDSRIKIIDFGTAESVKKDKLLTARVGSPYYVAPEVLAQSYGQKCDVWSCGVILYVLLCGYPPFRGRSHEEIFANISKAKLSFDDKAWMKISKEAKALIKSMLDRNPARRVTAEAAMNNPWTNQCSHSEPLGQDALMNMQRFFFKNKFVAVVQIYLANNAITQDQRDRLAQKFKQIDKDGSGMLDKSQLIQAYKTIYGMVNQQAIANIIDTIDTNGSGKIDFTEFLVATANQQKLFHRKALEQAFDFFDQDKTGFIESAELKELLGDSCDNEELLKIMDALDNNGDGMISRQEFINRLEK